MASVINTLMTDSGGGGKSSSSSKTTVQPSNTAASSSSSSSTGNIKTMDQIQAGIDKAKAQVASSGPVAANAVQGASSEQAAANRAAVADAFNTLVNNAKTTWNEAVNNSSSSNNGGSGNGRRKLWRFFRPRSYAR